MSGEDTAVIIPPCATINAPVRITPGEIVIDAKRMAIAAVACEPPLSEYDQSLHHLIAAPLSYTWDGQTLVMSNSRGTLTFERAD